MVTSELEECICVHGGRSTACPKTPSQSRTGACNDWTHTHTAVRVKKQCQNLRRESGGMRPKLAPKHLGENRHPVSLADTTNLTTEPRSARPRSKDLLASSIAKPSCMETTRNLRKKSTILGSLASVPCSLRRGVHRSSHKDCRPSSSSRSVSPDSCVPHCACARQLLHTTCTI